MKVYSSDSRNSVSITLADVTVTVIDRPRPACSPSGPRARRAPGRHSPSQQKRRDDGATIEIAIRRQEGADTDFVALLFYMRATPLYLSLSLPPGYARA
jgi:hypothetical protein